LLTGTRRRGKTRAVKKKGEWLPYTERRIVMFYSPAPRLLGVFRQLEQSYPLALSESHLGVRRYFEATP